MLSTEEKGDISGTDGRMEMVLVPKWSTKNADSDERNIQGLILRSGEDLPPKYKKATFLDSSQMHDSWFMYDLQLITL